MKVSLSVAVFSKIISGFQLDRLNKLVFSKNPAYFLPNCKDLYSNQFFRRETLRGSGKKWPGNEASRLAASGASSRAHAYARAYM